MATKKAGSTAKKTTRSKSPSTKKTETTVKAVSTTKKSLSVPRFKLTDKRTVVAAALIGEFIGAFLLTSAYLVTKGEPLYMGFVLVTLLLMVGTLSGAHLNPVVTVGAWVTRKLGNVRALTYVLAQLLGAGAAYVVLSTFISGYHTDASSTSALGQATPDVFKLAALTNNSHWYVFFAELLGSTIFAFAFASAWREKTDRVAKSITAGFGLFVAMLIAGVSVSYVGANIVLNPAIAVAASAVDWVNIDWFAVAAYLVAPLVGGVVGFALRDAVEV
ncbi:MAG: aquaporin [Candidatus Nomurabacteria bacterium]|nr:MAG: aquaporin [Candidatus Nomurabacteria bacterium]